MSKFADWNGSYYVCICSFLSPAFYKKIKNLKKGGGLLSTEIPSFNLWVHVGVPDIVYNKALERLIVLYL